MDRLIDREKGFECEYIIPSGDMPQFYWTQNMCIFSTDDDKNTVINKYVNMLLSDNYQIKIADTTASFPVTYAKLDYDGIRYDIVSSDYAGAMAIIPGMGISYDEIVSALHGDIGAKENLKGKLIIQ